MITKTAKKLTTTKRSQLPGSAFALPNRRYPIHDINHARAALAMVSKHGTKAEQDIVRNKVRSRYPEIGS